MKKSLGIISLMMLLSVEILTPITYAVEGEESDFESYVKESILDEVIQEETSEEIGEVSNQEDTEENLDEDNQEDEDSEISEEVDEAVIDETTEEVESAESEEEVKEESSEEASQSDTLEQFDFSKETRPAVIANKLGIDWEKEKGDYAILAGVEGEYIGSSEQNTQIKDYLIEHANEIVNGSEEVVEPEESVKSVEQEVIELNKEKIKGFKYYNGVTVNVSAPVESFPEGTTLSITPIKKAAELKEIKEQLVEQQDEVTEESNLVAFDISFIYNNEEVQPVENKSVEVTFNYGNHEAFSQAEENEEQEIKVYHLNDKDEDGNKQEVTVEEIEIVKTEEGKLTVDAESFSVYTIVTQVAEEGPNAIEDQLANFVYGQISIEDPDHPGQGITIMDRNLGATSTGIDSAASYGYYYQWGNNYGFHYSLGDTVTPVDEGLEWDDDFNNSGYISTGFIDGNNFEKDVWSDSTHHDGVWGGTNDSEDNGWGADFTNYPDRQGPCPSGWHIPSGGEWGLLVKYWRDTYATGVDLITGGNLYGFEDSTARQNFMNYFNIPFAGERAISTANLILQDSEGLYRSSSPQGSLYQNYARNLRLTSSYVLSDYFYLRSHGYPIRCFKDTYVPANEDDKNITFNFDGGSGVTASTYVKSGDKVEIPTVPVKLGYELEGWYNGEGEWTFEEDVVTGGEVVLQAHYTPITYTLAYEAGEGAGDTFEEVLTYNDNTYELAGNTVFSKTGYSFSGWKIGENDYAVGDHVENLTTTSGDVVTATAQWKANTYSVHFNANGGEGTMDDQEFVYDVDQNLTGNGFTKVGSQFTGWSLNSGIDNVAYTDEQEVSKLTTINNGIVNLYAQWETNKHTGTFNTTANGGVAVVENTKQIAYGTSGSLITPDFEPTKAGWTFLGWSLTQNSTDLIDDAYTMPDADVTFYAVFKKDITATFSGNNNQIIKSETEEVDEYEITKTIYNNETSTGFTAPDIKAHTNTPDVLGYSDAADNHTVTVATGDAFTLSESATYYAQTKKDYTEKQAIFLKGQGVSQIGGGSEHNLSRECTPVTTYNGVESDECDVTSPTITVEDTYTNAKWNNEYTGGSDITLNAPTTYFIAGSDSNVYKIYYVMNGGTNDPSNIGTFTGGTDVVITDPTKDDNVFLGWTFDGQDEPVTGLTLTGADKDYVLTANWKAEYYNIIYKNVEGSNNDEVNPDNSFSILNYPTIHAIEKTGYTFTGWTNASNNDLGTEFTIEFPGDKIYTAHWSLDEYTITFSGVENALDEEDNAFPGTRTYTYEDTFILPTPTKEGSIFKGWKAEDSGVVSKTVMINKSTGAKTFTAIWDDETYTISYELNGGTNNALNPSNYVMGDLPITLEDPSRDGYSFSGWTEGNTISAGSTGAKTFTAEWTPLQYTVTLNFYDAEKEVINYTVESGAIALASHLISRDGYEFAGWIGEGNTFPEKNVTIPAGSIGNKEYTAQWEEKEYSIIYEGVEGLINKNPSTYKISSNITLINPEKVGYEFAGWTGTDLSSAIDSVTISGKTGDRVYGANWTANSTTSYTVNHYQESLDGKWTPVETSFEEGESDSEVTKTANDYEGFTPISGSQTKTINPLGITRFDFKYTRNNYQFTVDYSGGVDANNNTSVTYTGKYGAPVEEIIPTRTGYTFGGWNVSYPKTMPAVANTLVIKANWTNNDYTITYNNVEYATNPNPHGYTTADEFDLEDAVWTGWKFEGWYTEDNGQGTKVTKIESTDIGNKVLYAYWTAKTDTQYTVNYELESLDKDGVYVFKESETQTGETESDTLPTLKDFIGYVTPTATTIHILADGSASVTYKYDRASFNLTVSHDETIDSVSGNGAHRYGDKITIETIAADGYEFTTVDKKTNKEYFTMPAENTGYTVTSATPIVYTIKYNYDGGVLSGDANPATYTIKSGDIVLNNNLSKTGYAFAGWMGTDIDATTPSVTIAEGSIGDREFIAIYSPKGDTEYKVIHVKQNLNQEYDATDASLVEEETLTGTTASNVTPTAKNYVGYTKAQEQEITILADGSSTVEYRYPRKSYSFTLENVEGVKTLGTSVNKDYLYESDITLVAEAQTGYTWQKWTITSGGVSEDNTNTSFVFSMPAAAVTATPVVSHNEYTLSFNAASGTSSMSLDDQTKHYDDEITLPVVTRTGYVFQGWFDDVNNVKYEANTKMPNNDVTLTAHWTEGEVNVVVNYYLMDLEGNYPATPSEVVELEKTTNSTYTGEVKTYEGFTSPEEQSVIVKADGSSVINYNYIRNKYTLTLNQATGFVYSDLSGTAEYYYGTELTVNGEVQTGYSWAGWQGLGEDESNSANAYLHFTMPAKHLTVTPKITENLYKVSFRDGEKIYWEGYVAYTEVIPLPETPTMLGYTFVGWKNLPEDGKMIAENLTLQVIWSRNPSSGGGGGGGGSSKSSTAQEHGSAPTTGDNAKEENKTIDENVETIEIENTEETQVENEEKEVYDWAYEYGITTLPTVDEADPNGIVLRGHMAKMVVNYVQNVLGREVPTVIPPQCHWTDTDWENEEIKSYAEKTCALGIMGIDMEKFLPNEVVTRAQFGTMLSRLLWGDNHNVKDSIDTPYYEEHLKALNEGGIIEKMNDPEGRIEIRKWIWLMLKRSKDNNLL